MTSEKLFICGHKGMVGKALVRSAEQRGYQNIITVDRNELDLRDQQAVFSYLEKHQPDCVIIAAAKVGGIWANSQYPAEFIYDNLSLEINLIEGSRRAGVKRLLFLGSSCIYPKFAEQPVREQALNTAALEPTNEAYAIAKISGLKMCQFYRQQYGLLYHSAMPTNLYGPGDNYHAENSHVIPALIRRFHEAKLHGDQEIAMWGTGTPLREFLHCDDLAEACFHLLELENPPDWINVGSGKEISIANLAQMVAKAVGYDGKIVNDLTKPDGCPRKFLDTQLILSSGWRPQISLQEGLKAAYSDFLSSLQDGSARVG